MKIQSTTLIVEQFTSLMIGFHLSSFLISEIHFLKLSLSLKYFGFLPLIFVPILE